MKSKGTAIVLALFLGGLGIHKFYLDRSGLGVIYLIFCLTGVPAILAIIDVITLLAMSKDRFNKLYN